MLLVNRTDVSKLKELSFSRDLVSVSNIPDSFKPEFDRFFFGKTLVKKDNVLFAYPHDIKNWVRYVFQTYSE